MPPLIFLGAFLDIFPAPPWIFFGWFWIMGALRAPIIQKQSKKNQRARKISKKVPGGENQGENRKNNENKYRSSKKMYPTPLKNRSPKSRSRSALGSTFRGDLLLEVASWLPKKTFFANAFFLCFLIFWACFGFWGPSGPPKIQKQSEKNP